MNLLMKTLLLSDHQRQSKGFTLLEVMATMVIIAVALVAVAPALIVAAAARVHSERIETASNLATLEIERIQSIVARGVGDYTVGDLPGAGAIGTVPANFDGFDINGDGTDDYYIGAFRFNEVADCEGVANPALPCAFSVGVYVYSRLAFDGGTFTGSATDLNPLDGNVNSVEGALQAKERPLVFSQAEVGSVATLEEICLLAGGANCP